ncbi:hypothetical protein CANCADRAFT_3992 [Tortispora caseinolytica NRRL Y-17796]|uniref:Uncharacterized protein n=1 Tax=Tortispora caseinolytica NRRL Y-17796 TaxID=767744 RepID=A0A1E4TC78_9ASCO|nr:hypothetical protein CANCADRAFT_3992 [Tortispora caseinolytica NRRL Y-17796]
MAIESLLAPVMLPLVVLKAVYIRLKASAVPGLPLLTAAGTNFAPSSDWSCLSVKRTGLLFTSYEVFARAPTHSQLPAALPALLPQPADSTVFAAAAPASRRFATQDYRPIPLSSAELSKVPDYVVRRSRLFRSKFKVYKRMHVSELTRESAQTSLALNRLVARISAGINAHVGTCIPANDSLDFPDHVFTFQIRPYYESNGTARRFVVRGVTYQWSKEFRLEKFTNTTKIHIATVVNCSKSGFDVYYDSNHIEQLNVLTTALVSFIDHWNSPFGIGGVYLSIPRFLNSVPTTSHSQPIIQVINP